MNNTVILRAWAELRAIRYFLRGTIAEYLLVGMLFFVLTLVYTDFVLFHGTQKLFIEGPGDGTAGFLWLTFASNDNGGFLGNTDLINYPLGANLTNPTYITYIAQLMPLLLLGKIVGPVLALNLVTYFAFISCGVLMYWLMKGITGNWIISIFSAYAATFVPYHIINSSSHLSYIFSGVFVMIFAALYGLMRGPSIVRAVVLGLVLALAFYTDGYFILLASVFVLNLLVGYLLYVLITYRSGKIDYLWTRVKYLSAAAGVLLVALLPMAYVQLTQSDNIESSLATARGSIISEIEVYKAKPMDFIVPSVHHPLLMESPEFQQLQKYKNSRSNAMENTLYIGFTLIALAAFASVMVGLYYVLRKRSALAAMAPEKREKIVLLTVVCLSAMPLFLIWMVGIDIAILGYRIPMPPGILVDFGIALWRVYARMFLPLHILIVIMAGVGLYITSQYVSKQKRFGVVILCLMAILGIEYATMTSRPAYNFLNTPEAYYWLRDQEDIDVIAELPFVDRPLETNYDYVTAQIIHGKKLINSHLTSVPIGTHNALGDIENSEAINFSIIRGAQAIVTRGEKCDPNISWGTLAYEDANADSNKESFYYGSPLCVYRVTGSSSDIDPFFIELEHGSFSDILTEVNDNEFNVVYGDRGTLRVKDSRYQSVAGQASLIASVVNAPEGTIKNATWSVWQDNIKIQEGRVGADEINCLINANQPIEVRFTDPGDLLYQFALKDITVTKEAR